MASLPALGSMSRGLRPVVNAERPLPGRFPLQPLSSAPCGPTEGQEAVVWPRNAPALPRHKALVELATPSAFLTLSGPFP